MGKQPGPKTQLSNTPYKGYQLPGTLQEEENRMAEEVDPNLRPEDHGMVLRYLHYADTLLNSPEEEDRSSPFLLRERETAAGRALTREPVEKPAGEKSDEKESGRAA